MLMDRFEGRLKQFSDALQRLEDERNSGNEELLRAHRPGLLNPNVENLSGEGHFCYFSLAPCRMRIAV